MKKLKNGVYEASNVSFDPSKIEATSYNWWTFVIEYRGYVIFNAYTYSPTTRRHQAKVRALMELIGIQTDIVVETKHSLTSAEGQSLVQKLLNEEPLKKRAS